MADSLAICRAKGKPLFFITVTTNPNWPEIRSQLKPGQSASDIHTIVCRVFKACLENAIAKMKLRFGAIVYMVRVIEFQQRGLPHAHIVLKVCQYLCRNSITHFSIEILTQELTGTIGGAIQSN